MSDTQTPNKEGMAGNDEYKPGAKLFDREPVMSELSKRLRPVGRVLEDPDYNVWGCSPIYDEQGRVHVFYSKWKNIYGHYGWVAACEIGHAVADSAEGPYTVLDTVLEGRGGDAWDSWSIHNPTVHKIGDKYAIFYMGSDGSQLGVTLEDIMKMDTDEYRPYFHKLVASKAVGLAVADSLDGPWTRVSDEAPVVPHGPTPSWDDFVSSNPAFLQHPNGECWLYYKGWDAASAAAFNGNRKYGVAIAEQLEGPYKKHENNPIIDFSNIAPQVQCEDAYVWMEDGKFNIILRDMGFYNHEYGITMQSEDGINWSEPEIAFLDAPTYFDEKMPGLDREGRFERPQLLLGPNGPTHLFCAYRGGKYKTSSGVVLAIEPK